MKRALRTCLLGNASNFVVTPDLVLLTGLFSRIPKFERTMQIDVDPVTLEIDKQVALKV